MPNNTITIYARKKNIDAILVVNAPLIYVETKKALIKDKIGQTVK
jgi:hypothetical protein